MTESKRPRQFYIDTAFPAAHLGAVREHMAALRISEHYKAVKYGGIVVVLSAGGKFFSQLSEAERAQQILQRGAPDVFGQSAVAFIEHGTGELIDDVPDRCTSTFKPLAQARTVVCVDDDEAFTILVAKILKQLGVKCIAARSGQGALATIEDVEPDLVLLDLIMPGMHGWEVIQQMKASALLRDIPVIIVTGMASEQDQVFAHMVANVNGYLEKPVDPDVLRQHVWDALVRRG